MTAHITVLDGNVLRIMELVGDSASEVARISLKRADAQTVTTVVTNLLPFLAPAGFDKLNGVPVPAKTPRSTRIPTARRSVAEKQALAVAYVRDHPGAHIIEIAAALDLVGGQGAAFHNMLRSAGIRLDKAPTNKGRMGYRWEAFLDEPAAAPVKVTTRKKEATS